MRSLLTLVLIFSFAFSPLGFAHEDHGGPGGFAEAAACGFHLRDAREPGPSAYWQLPDGSIFPLNSEMRNAIRERNQSAELTGEIKRWEDWRATARRWAKYGSDEFDKAILATVRHPVQTPLDVGWSLVDGALNLKTEFWMAYHRRGLIAAGIFAGLEGLEHTTVPLMKFFPVGTSPICAVIFAISLGAAGYMLDLNSLLFVNGPVDDSMAKRLVATKNYVFWKRIFKEKLKEAMVPGHPPSTWRKKDLQYQVDTSSPFWKTKFWLSTLAQPAEGLAHEESKKDFLARVTGSNESPMVRFFLAMERMAFFELQFEEAEAEYVQFRPQYRTETDQFRIEIAKFAGAVDKYMRLLYALALNDLNGKVDASALWRVETKIREYFENVVKVGESFEHGLIAKNTEFTENMRKTPKEIEDLVKQIRRGTITCDTRLGGNTLSDGELLPTEPPPASPSRYRLRTSCHSVNCAH